MEGVNNTEPFPPLATGHCPMCQATTRAGQKFCAFCGQKLSTVSEIVSRPTAAAPLALPDVITRRLATYRENHTPRELELHLGLALCNVARYGDAVQALQRARAEAGARPPKADVLFLLAKAHDLAGARDQAVRSYLEAVVDEPGLADKLLPYLHHQLTAEIATTLRAWFETEWEEAVSTLSTESAQLMHIDTFRCRMHLYLGNHVRARDCLQRAKSSDPGLFGVAAPELLAVETLPAAVTSVEDGNSLLALAEIFHILGQPHALALIDQAIASGLNDGTKYPDAPALALKAALLESQGDLEQAASLFYEAGKRYSWRKESVHALRLLEHARSLNPQHAPTYWYQMDVQRELSYAEQYPYVHPEYVKAGLRTWDEGIRVGEPDKQFAWAYVSRALLNDQLTRFPNADVPEANWEAVALLEQGLLLANDDTYFWAYLGRFHRAMLNSGCALEATQKAVDLDGVSLAALEERAMILSDVGDIPAALEFIERRRSLESTPNVWLDALKAYNLLLTGPHSEVLSLLNNAISTAPSNLWYIELRAGCYRLMKLWSSATEDSKRIWSHYDPHNVTGRNRFAWAAYYIGEVDTARGIFERLASDPVERSSAHRGMGLCAMASGDLEQGTHHLEIGIAEARERRDLDELLLIDFPFAEYVAAERSNATAVRRTLSGLTPAVEKYRSTFSRSRSAETELQAIVDGLTRTEAVHGWAWIGAHAGLARARGQAKQWVAAATLYRLLNETGRFPRAVLGMANAVHGLNEQASSHLRTGRLHEAEECLRQALAFAETPAHSQEHGNAQALLGMTHFSAGKHDEADLDFIQALHSYRQSSVIAGQGLAEQCRPFLETPSHYWALSESWQRLAATSNIRATDREDLRVAHGVLSSYLSDAFGLSEVATPDNRLPIATPIILEVGDELLPFVDPARDEGRFLQEDIPAMRARIEETLGLPVPGVRVRPYAGSRTPNAYNIQLEEATVAVGNAYPMMRYCPAPVATLEALGISSSVMVPAVDLASGSVGAWVPADHWDTLMRDGLAAWTASAFLIVQLEAVIQQNAATFLGVQEVDTLIRKWEGTGEGAALIAGVLGDQRARLRFGRLLRALVREQVPIKSWREIVEVVRERGLDDPERAIHEVRGRLKRMLMGDPSERRVTVPPEWEGFVRRENGRVWFAVSGAETQALIATVHAWMQADNPPHVLVTRTPELRVLVRRLVTTDFPHLKVLAQSELSSGEAVPAAQEGLGARGEGARANA